MQRCDVELSRIIRKRIEKDGTSLNFNCSGITTRTSEDGMHAVLECSGSQRTFDCVIYTPSDVPSKCKSVLTYASGAYLASVGKTESEIMQEVMPYEKAYMQGEYNSRTAPSSSYHITKLIYSKTAPHTVLGCQHFGFIDVEKRMDVVS